MKALENPTSETIKHRLENKKYYKKHAEKLILKSRTNYQRFKSWYQDNGYTNSFVKRIELIEIFGGRCIKCLNDDWRVLQIDHINGGGSKERKTFSSPHMYRKHILLNVENYQLLCANCNWIKRYEKGEKKINI